MGNVTEFRPHHPEGVVGSAFAGNAIDGSTKIQWDGLPIVGTSESKRTPALLAISHIERVLTNCFFYCWLRRR